PERPSSRPPPGGALCPGGYPVLAGRVAPGARAFGAESSPLQSAAAPCPRLSLWGGRRGVFPRLYVLAPVVARLSAAGGAEEPGGADPGAGGVARVQPGSRAVLCGRGASVASGGAGSPSTGRGGARADAGARV